MTNKSIIKIFAASLSTLLVLASCDITKNNEPLAPLGEPAVTAQITTHELNISWEPVTGADTYVYVFDGCTSVSTKATHVQFTDLKAGTDYSFSVKAVASDGASLNSNETSKVFTTLAEDITLKATLAEASFNGITVEYEAGVDVVCINWYLGSEFTYEADYAAFVAGETTQSLTEPTGEFTVKTAQGLQLGEPSVIFIQPVSYEGVKGDIIEINATAAPVSFTPSLISLGSFVATVNAQLNSEYSGMGFLSASKEEIEYYASVLEMSVKEVFLMFESSGYVTPLAPGDSEIEVLNGEPDVDHYIGLFYYGTDQTLKAFSALSYNSGAITPDAYDATIDVKVENIAENSADLVFNPGKNTCGYVYRLFTKADFEKYYSKGEDYGYLDPLEYIRIMVDAAGTRNYLANTDSRTALKAGDYVLVTCPYNVNGTQGWGDTVLSRFSTAAPAGEVAAKVSSSASEPLSEPESARVDKISKLLGKIAR